VLEPASVSGSGGVPSQAERHALEAGLEAAQGACGDVEEEEEGVIGGEAQDLGGQLPTACGRHSPT
jgi:hypothetical protein